MQTPSIHIQHISKKFQRNLLYKGFSLDVFPQDKIAITGPNGSGKSTLLKLMIGLISPTSGSIEYKYNQHPIERSKWHKYVNVAAPYMNLMDDFTVLECVEHINSFRQFQLPPSEMIKLLELAQHLHKPIKYLSSGMKQKLKLMLAIMDRAPVLLLDEPLSNMDERNTQWYSEMIHQWAMSKTIIVFSNHQKKEYSFCGKQIELS